MHNMHSGWSRMLISTVMSEIENKRRPIPVLKEENEVNIANRGIFEDLNFMIDYAEGYKKLYIKIFEDFSKYKLNETSSVRDRGDDLPSLYGKIKLYAHIKNSLMEMIKIIDENERAYAFQKDIFLLIILLHDIGKSHALCADYAIDLKMEHCERSAAYFKKIVAEEDDNFQLDETSFNIIYTTVYMHHKFVNEETKYLKILKQADSSARNKELEELEALREEIK